jgi:hypothetical protein
MAAGFCARGVNFLIFVDRRHIKFPQRSGILGKGNGVIFSAPRRSRGAGGPSAEELCSFRGVQGEWQSPCLAGVWK